MGERIVPTSEPKEPTAIQVIAEDLCRIKPVAKSAAKYLCAVAIGLGAGTVAVKGNTETFYAPHNKVGVKLETVFKADFKGGSKIETPTGDDINFDTHKGPLGVEARLDNGNIFITAEKLLKAHKSHKLAEQLRADLPALEEAKDNLLDDNVKWFLITSILVGACARGLMEWRRLKGRIALQTDLTTVTKGALASGAATAAFGGGIYQTVNPNFIDSMTITGENVEFVKKYSQAIDKLDEHDESVTDDLINALQLKKVMDQLAPVAEKPAVKVGVMSDSHDRDVWSMVETYVKEEKIDFLIILGDTVEFGKPFNNGHRRDVTKAIRKLGIPVVMIKGNHEDDKTMAKFDKVKNVIVLNGQKVTISGIDITGVGDPASDYSYDDIKNHENKQNHQTQRDLLRAAIERNGPVDIAIAHSPAAADTTTNKVRVQMFGHHHPKEPIHGRFRSGTLRFVQGSTGGGGVTLRDMVGNEESTKWFSIYHLDKDGKPLAVEDFGTQSLFGRKFERNYQTLSCIGACANPADGK